MRSWLLIEHAGPWGRDAFVDARLPSGLGPELAARCRTAGVRPLLIRRRHRDRARWCFAIRSGPGRPWIERTQLDRTRDVLQLDLDALGRGARLGLEPVEGPLFLVCTHGRHDPCCAERGRPLVQALAAAFPEATWESSHVGGDRFAGNLLAFPHGLYLGRVGPGDAERVARAYRDGRVALEHLRGRSCWPMAVQAAEHALRASRGLDGVDDLTVEAVARQGHAVHVTFGTPGGTVTVGIGVGASEPRPLTCASETPRGAPTYRVLSMT